MLTKNSGFVVRVLRCCGIALIWMAVPGCRQEHKVASPAPNVSPSSSPAAVAAASPVAAVSPIPTRPKDWSVAEEFDFDWQGNGAPAHFRIEHNEAEQESRLTIRIKGKPDFVLDNDEDLVEIAENFTKEETFLGSVKSTAASKYALALTPSPSAKALVFLTARQYASNPEDLFIFALDSSGGTKLILKKELHLEEFRDLDGDGVAEVVGVPCFSQGWGHDFLTYDPYHVYKLQAMPKPELKLSLPLTEQYNREHYYGWAGPDCSEQLTVVLHPPGGGKPVIVKSKEAEKMFEKNK